MIRISDRVAVEEENGRLFVMRCDELGTRITDKIPLDEHELRELIKFSHNALGVPAEDPFPYEEADQ